VRDYPKIVVPPPGPKAKAIVERDEAWAAHAYIKEYPLVIAGGRGPVVEDVDGNRFLDFMAGIAVCATGYGHPAVVSAVKDAADRFLHICGSDFYFEGMAALCERLARLAPGASRKRVFLTNSGTEAVEGAIKLARYATRRTAIIAFRGAFHGRSTGAVSLTSSKARQHAGFGPLLPDVHHVPYAYRYRCQFCADQGECTRGCIETIEQDLFTRHLDPHDVAAIFVEPVQGEGGYIVPPKGWLGDLRALCDRYGILLVADEVQCGVGRTGKMWACEHEGVEPDILLTAKGLGSGMPIGAIIAKESIDTWESGAHGSTFGGNPVCCAAALATLDLVEGGLMANAARMGERPLAGLRALERKHGCIGEVRGVGLMIGVEFVKDRQTREPAPDLLHTLVMTAFQRGLLLLGAGKSTLRLAPPLVVDEEDVDIALAMLDGILGELD
jgi:4-aminobutyrate aminotransferase